MAAFLKLSWTKEWVNAGETHVTTIVFDSPYGKVPAGTEFNYTVIDAYAGGYAGGQNQNTYYVDGAYPDAVIATGDETPDQFMERIRVEMGEQLAVWYSGFPSALSLSVVKQSPVSYELQLKLRNMLYQGPGDQTPPGTVPATLRVSPINVDTPFMVTP